MLALHFQQILTFAEPTMTKKSALRIALVEID